jgi:hypothetical protein
MPNVPKETPTPIPIFLLSLVFVGFEGTKFQPFIWIPVTAAPLVAVDIDVTHAEADSFEFVIVEYITMLICCPTDKVDWHWPGPPAPELAMKE